MTQQRWPWTRGKSQHRSSSSFHKLTHLQIIIFSILLLHPSLSDRALLTLCGITSLLLQGAASLAFTKQYQQQMSGMMGLERCKTETQLPDKPLMTALKTGKKFNFIWKCETCKMLKNTSKSCYTAQNAQGVLHPNVGHWLTCKWRENINIKSNGMAGCNFSHLWEYFMWDLCKYLSAGAQKSP